MNPKNSDALHELQLTLARWKSPSAWDVVNRDEPLDPAPEGKWESTTAGTTGAVAITIPSPTASGWASNVSGALTTTLSSILRAVMGDVTQEEDRAVIQELERAAASLGTQVTVPRPEPSTAVENGNLPSRRPVQVPFPRNHKERRIFKSIERKLPELIRQVEKKHGPRTKSTADDWNAEFWKMVTRPEVERTQRARKTRT